MELDHIKILGNWRPLVMNLRSFPLYNWGCQQLLDQCARWWCFQLLHSQVSSTYCWELNADNLVEVTIPEHSMTYENYYDLTQDHKRRQKRIDDQSSMTAFLYFEKYLLQQKTRYSMLFVEIRESFFLSVIDHVLARSMWSGCWWLY
jgi:hypothetical protein